MKDPVEDVLTAAREEKARVLAGADPSFSFALETVLEMASRQMVAPEDSGADPLLESQYDAQLAAADLVGDMLTNYAEELDAIAGEPDPGGKVPQQVFQNSRGVLVPLLPSQALARLLSLATLDCIEPSEIPSEAVFQNTCLAKGEQLVQHHGGKLDRLLRIAPLRAPGP